MNMFLAASVETEEGRELEERAGGGEEGKREGWRGDGGRRRGEGEMFLMTLESDTRTATQLPLQDFSLSLHLHRFLPSFSLLLLLHVLSLLLSLQTPAMMDGLGQNKVKVKKEQKERVLSLLK